MGERNTLKPFGRKAVLCFCMLLFAVGCNTSAGPDAEGPAPAEPTPIVIGGQIAENGVLRAIVEAEDFARIEQIPDLKTLDVTGSDCYEAILGYASSHPDVEVLYSVAIGGETIPNVAAEASVSRVPDASLLTFLPNLRALTVTEPMTGEKASALLDALPDAALDYAVDIGGKTVRCTDASVDLSDVSPNRCESLAQCVRALPNLSEVRLNREDGSTDWTLEQAKPLMDAQPGLRVELNTEAFGVPFSLTDDVVVFSGIPLAEHMDELLALLPYLYNVGRLDMEECGIPDEEMGRLREAYPSPKIVWRVHVGVYSCRTDVRMIHFADAISNPMLTDADVPPLIYCNEVKYLDLGHNLIQNPYFVAYMPDLEVCIVAIHEPTDISAFAHCPKLEYAELFNGSVSDVSALAACTELKHLNLSMNEITDITPLYGLVKLERLWISNNPIPEEQVETFRKLVPDCVVNTTAEDPTLNEWRWDTNRPNWYAERYELLRKQFQYDLRITSYVEEPDFD